MCLCSKFQSDSPVLSDPETRLERLRDYLGQNVVLLPIPIDQKGCKEKNWQKTSFEQTQSPEYRNRLLECNIGVLLGPASGNLCTIDIDSDDPEVFQRFLIANPKLKSTFHTKRKNPGNFWVRFLGPYPKSTVLKLPDGRRFGELRAKGNQTVVFGEVDGVPYEIVNSAPVIEIEFSDLNFLEGTEFRYDPVPQKTSCNAVGTEDAGNAGKSSPVPLHNMSQKSPAQMRIEQDAFMQKLKGLNQKLPTYFERHILHPYRDVKAGERNNALVDLTTKLYARLRSKLVQLFLEGFYIFYGYRFKDTFERHMHETKSSLQALEMTFLNSLNSEEKEYYECLMDQSREQEAFRICRRLVEYEKEGSKQGRFFLSCNQLSLRLGLNSDVKAYRILTAFERHGVVRVVTRGTRRTTGQRGKATEWEWGFEVGCSSRA